jgi:hypothetical protein
MSRGIVAFTPVATCGLPSGRPCQMTQVAPQDYGGRTRRPGSSFHRVRPTDERVRFERFTVQLRARMSQTLEDVVEGAGKGWKLAEDPDPGNEADRVLEGIECGGRGRVWKSVGKRCRRRSSQLALRGSCGSPLRRPANPLPQDPDSPWAGGCCRELLGEAVWRVRFDRSWLHEARRWCVVKGV